MSEPTPRGNTPLHTALRWTLRLLLTGGVTWFVLSRVGVSVAEVEAGAAFLGTPRWGLLTLSSLLLLAGLLFSARLWGRMVRELGGEDPGFFPAARIVFSANLGRYLPGKVWQVAGFALLARRAAIPMAIGTAAALLIQGFLLLAAAVAGAPALATLLGGFGETTPAGTLLGPVGALLVLALLLTARPVLSHLLSFGFRITRVPRESAPTLRKGFGLRWLSLHLLIWMGHGLAFALFVAGLGLPVTSAAVVPAFAGAYLLGYLALFAPAGIGVREGFLIAFLRPELGAAAVSVALLARIWMTVVELVPAGALALWEVYRVPSTGGEDEPGVGVRSGRNSRERGGEGA